MRGPKSLDYGASRLPSNPVATRYPPDVEITLGVMLGSEIAAVVVD